MGVITGLTAARMLDIEVRASLMKSRSLISARRKEARQALAAAPPRQ